MADEKDTRRSKLYDSPASKKARPAEKPADKEAAATAEADMAAGDTPKADAELKPVMKASERFLDALGKLRKLQEKERGDHHNQNREALRSMAKRHDDAIGQLFESMGGDEALAAEVSPTADQAMEA